jgi:hypothetical protein
LFPVPFDLNFDKGKVTYQPPDKDENIRNSSLGSAKDIEFILGMATKGGQPTYHKIRNNNNRLASNEVFGSYKAPKHFQDDKIYWMLFGGNLLITFI